MRRDVTVRLMSTEINHLKNVNFGIVDYMNKTSINKDATIKNTDIVGIYGQNGSGKTALVEALDILKYIISEKEVPYDEYGGLIPANCDARLSYAFYIDIEGMKKKYKAEYSAVLRANETNRKVEIIEEQLNYWDRGATWKNRRDIGFQNPFYNLDDILTEENVEIKTSKGRAFNDIPFLFSMRSLGIYCAQKYVSIFFNRLMRKGLDDIRDSSEAYDLNNVIHALYQFGCIDLHVIKVSQLATINKNYVIPLNFRYETESSVIHGLIPLFTDGVGELPLNIMGVFSSTIDAINIALKSVIPNLKIELIKKNEIEKENGERYVQVEVYSRREENRFLFKYESEGIKRIVSLMHYMIAVYNNSNVCLVVDELDSGIYEYLLGEILGLMYKEMKGQLIFTSHNLRVLEKLGTKNIVCSTVNPDNRYIRLKGVEKNHNKRDFYIRTITVGGQNEDLYDEDDLTSMGYAFRKAGRIKKTNAEISFSKEFKELRSREEGKHE
ncbi:MAG: ATP-binding protein [Eubacterium sp.]|nr:ATP-binding protein [Eubacterium sp.]